MRAHAGSIHHGEHRGYGGGACGARVADSSGYWREPTGRAGLSGRHAQAQEGGVQTDATGPTRFAPGVTGTALIRSLVLSGQCSNERIDIPEVHATVCVQVGVTEVATRVLELVRRLVAQEQHERVDVPEVDP
jgi:hypothetical protein